MLELDVKGYSRGIPLVRVQEAIRKNPGVVITVLLDTAWSLEDVTRYAQKQGYTVEKSGEVGNYKLILTPGGQT